MVFERWPTDDAGRTVCLSAFCFVTYALTADSVHKGLRLHRPRLEEDQLFNMGDEHQ